MNQDRETVGRSTCRAVGLVSLLAVSFFISFLLAWASGPASLRNRG